MNNKGPYEKDIHVFMRVCRRMSLDTCAWYFYTMSPYLWAALCISEHFIAANVNIKSSFQVLMVKYQIAQQVFKRNFDRFSIACDHSSIIIINIIATTTTTTTRSLYFWQKWNYDEIGKIIIINRQNKLSWIILKPRGWRNRWVFEWALYKFLLLSLSLLLLTWLFFLSLNYWLKVNWSLYF